MIIATTNEIPGREIKDIFGVVRGSTVRARWFGADIAAGLKQIVGGEIATYTSMISSAREEAESRMVEEAKKLGADAIIGMRFSTSTIMTGAAEIMAYGTAVKLS